MPNVTRHNGSQALIDNLRLARCYPHPVTVIQQLETHISWVLLSGDYAYKIKKPVNLGFLDFSTLERRRHCCEEELRLNLRLAPQIYLDVARITGTTARPEINGDGPVIEYAVRMRQFSQDALASALLAAGRLVPQQLLDFAVTLAAFHQAAPATDANSAWGNAQAILASALQNFDQLSPLLTASSEVAALAALRKWTLHEHGVLQAAMEQRRITGRVREGHGDLHLGNIVLIDGHLVPFDCIEFNPALRWNDVLSEAAFLVMDLQDRGSPRLGWLFLNAYLEQTGDYDGLPLLPCYLVYRAMVRAKVHGLRAAQPGLDGRKRVSLLEASRAYLALAQTYAHRPPPALIITHGLSGSGKSRIAGELMQQLGAIRIRSDVERKSLHHLEPRDRSGDAVGAGIYNDQSTADVYHHLAGLAWKILAAGCTTIVDATFLQRWQRDLLHGVARNAGARFLVMAVSAPEAVLRTRIAQRAAAGNDPSDAGIMVLEHQLQTRQALADAERVVAVEMDSDTGTPEACCRNVIAALAAMQATQESA